MHLEDSRVFLERNDLKTVLICADSGHLFEAR